MFVFSRTFTGAWIEIFSDAEIAYCSLRRTFTGAWIEIFIVPAETDMVVSHLHRCVD